MILEENSKAPARQFDVAIVAVGYERRCRFICESFSIECSQGIGLEFGFLAEAAYQENKSFFSQRSYQIIQGLNKNTIECLVKNIQRAITGVKVSVFVDISAMSREMIANVALALHTLSKNFEVKVTIGYAPSKFSGKYEPLPIRKAAPIRPELSGWTSKPELPLGAIFCLGCEPGLALGALQYLEPSKSWLFYPTGFDQDFDHEVHNANEHIGDIFDVSRFDFELSDASRTRGRFVALLNSLEARFRVVVVPFGPKIFAWLSIATVIFENRRLVGVWSFSSKEHGKPVDREASGEIVWHTLTIGQN